MKNIWIAFLILSISPFATAEKIKITRSAPWQPSELLIQTLALQPNLCATARTSVIASGDHKLDASKPKPKKPSVAEADAKPDVLKPESQSESVEVTEARRLHHIKASRAAANALLAARKLQVPQEYDSVWLDYQAAMALIDAGDMELVSKLLGFVAEPTSLVYEEQLFAQWRLSSMQAPKLAEGADISRKICYDNTGLSEDLVYPPELVDLGIGGSVLLYVEIKPDQSPGRVWIHASSHSAFEKPALRAVGRHLPKYCLPQPQSGTGFAALPISFGFEDGQPSAKQEVIFDPVYDYTSTKAYRSVDGEPGCEVPAPTNPVLGTDSP